MNIRTLIYILSLFCLNAQHTIEAQLSTALSPLNLNAAFEKIHKNTQANALQKAKEIFKYINFCILPEKYLEKDPNYFKSLVRNTKQLDPKYQKIIRSIVEKVSPADAEKLILLQYTWPLSWFGNFASLGNRIMIINASYFKTLTSDEQTMIIGHEYIHLKKHHTLKETSVQSLLSCLRYVACTPFKAIKAAAQRAPITTTTSKPIINTVDNLTQKITNVSEDIFMAYSRHCERQADKGSARLFKNTIGGYTFFTKCLKDELNGRWIDTGLETHPAHAERAAFFLKKARKEYKNSPRLIVPEPRQFLSHEIRVAIFASIITSIITAYYCDQHLNNGKGLEKVKHKSMIFCTKICNKIRSLIDTIPHLQAGRYLIQTQQ